LNITLLRTQGEQQMTRESIPLLYNQELDLVEFSYQVDWSKPTEFAKAIFSLDRDYDALLAEVEAAPQLAKLSWQNGKTLLHSAACDCQPKLANALIRLGANVEANYDEQGTPLHEAARSACVEVAISLLACGSNPNATGGRNSTPLHEAADNADAIEVTRLLLEHGADANRKNANGDTALDVAARRIHSEIIQVLIEHGASTENADTRNVINRLKSNNWVL
jgi:ankyrin repeat protein